MNTAGILALESDSEVKRAHEYFSGIKASAASNEDFSGYNKYGMVDIVKLLNRNADMKIENEMTLNAVIESLSNILIAGALKHAGTDDKAKVSADEWRKAFNALSMLFFSTYTVEELEYNEKKMGKDAVQKIIDVAFNVSGEPSSALKTDILAYLSSQGTLMETSGYGATYKYPYTLLGFSNFIKDEVHTCSLRAYFTELDSSTIEISHSCKSSEKAFDFKFKVSHCNADFMLQNWETNPDFRLRVTKFINDHIPQTPYFDKMRTTQNFKVR